MAAATWSVHQTNARLRALQRDNEAMRQANTIEEPTPAELQWNDGLNESLRETKHDTGQLEQTVDVLNREANQAEANQAEAN